MLPEIYKKIYDEKDISKSNELKIYLPQDVEDYYKIVNDIETGRKEAEDILYDFLNHSLYIPYPEAIIVEKLPILKYKGNFYPILGKEDSNSIRINKAFYTVDCFPIIIDLDENEVYTLPICYKIKDDATSTISHEFLHHALRYRIINEALVHKLSENR